jgi:ABC-type antimicrobial peptide transport system permease subunit
MERYHSLYWLYTILAPLILGVIALALIALPGDPSTGRMLIGLAVYIVIAVVGGAVVTRRLDR